MVWYYRDGDQENGPVSKAELQALIKSKKVGAQTLVRSVEMNDWVPLIDAVRGTTAPSRTTPPPPDRAPEMKFEAADTPVDDDFGELAMEETDPAPEEVQSKDMAVAGAGGASSTVVCSQCGRSFPQDQVIAYDDQMICAACKPMFVQKLKEGVGLPAIQNYAGFWIRFVAKFIDYAALGLVQWAIMAALSAIIMPNLLQSSDPSQITGVFALIGISALISLTMQVFYYTFFLGRWGATVGKMACRLKVVTPEGGKITYMRAFGRFFAEWISGIILYVGYIMAGFDDEKRALHDRICSTRVVKKA